MSHCYRSGKFGIENSSVCSTGSLDYPHVLSAMQVPYDYIAGSVRFSFSHLNQPEDVKIIVERMKQIWGLV